MLKQMNVGNSYHDYGQGKYSKIVKTAMICSGRVFLLDPSIQRLGQRVMYSGGQTDIFKSFTSANCISVDIPGYSSNEYIIGSGEKLVFDEQKICNLVKLNKIASLKNDWNEKGAKAFSEEFIKNVRCIVTALKIQPELFPTANSSIQIEYGNDKGAYLEIELIDSDKAEVFTVDEYGNESYSEVDANVEEINKVVNRFYE